MNGRFLVDTNVLVYAYDRSEPEKQIRALEVLDRLAETQRGAITAQVMGEFFVAVTRKIPAPLSPTQAMERVQNYWLSWRLLDLTPMIVLEAARGVRDHQFSYWDAQIWAAARLNQIPVVLSEDFNPGSAVEGVRFVNPFETGFEFDEWLGK
jgi:predicted nucleic acid-binding protein